MQTALNAPRLQPKLFFATSGSVRHLPSGPRPCSMYSNSAPPTRMIWLFALQSEATLLTFSGSSTTFPRISLAVLGSPGDERQIFPYKHTLSLVPKFYKTSRAAACPRFYPPLRKTKNISAFCVYTLDIPVRRFARSSAPRPELRDDCICMAKGTITMSSHSDAEAIQTPAMPRK